MASHSAERAFTLVEILIVVVLLGILAAIVVPQFTNTADDAVHTNLLSQLHTVRGQIELYNAQRPDPVFGDYGPATPVATFWDGLVNNDYLQQAPRNPLQDPATATAVGGAAGPAVAWVWDGTDIFATDGAGAIYIE